MRVVVMGGTGNFGARIVRALKDEPGIQLVATGRRLRPVPGAPHVQVVSVDIASVGFESALGALRPDVVVHTVGPFQEQDYRVVRAALGCGAHYLDLADGRAFVTRFTPAVDALARSASRVAITGASTLPALSSAVVDELTADGLIPDTIEIAIAPGQRAPRGVATLQAVFSYLGRPVRVWEGGRWMQRTGWMDLRRVPLAFGSRWGALCDVPDLALFPERYPSVKTVRFHAALEFKIQQLMLWGLAGLIKLGIPLPVTRWCAPLDRLACSMDGFGGAWGGMRVSVVGDKGARRLRRTWLLTVPAVDGPEIPCMAALCLIRRLAQAGIPEPGAGTCAGVLRLGEFQEQFDRWGIKTAIQEEA